VFATVTLASPRFVTAAPVATLPASVRLVDAWDRSDDIGRYRGMPTLLVYEDKDSAQTNIVLKRELGDLAKGDRYKRSISLIAMADVSSYDYWPARGFVKDAIKKESVAQATLIFCDWNGSVRNALGLRAHASNIVLYGRDGAILFSHVGALSAERRAELIGLLRRQVEGQK
jgi:hypothetical protein